MRSLAERARTRTLPLTGEALWVAGGQLLCAVGGVVGVRILTGLLTPAHYGLFWSALTGSLLVQHVVWAPLHAAIVRFHSQQGELNSATLRLASFRLAGILGAIVGFAGLIVASGALATGGLAVAQHVGLAAVISIGAGWEGALAQAHMATRNRWPMTLYVAGLTWIRLLCASAAVARFGSSSAVALCGYGAGVGIGLTLQLVIARRPRGRASLVAAAQREMTKYMMPFALWGSFSWVQAVSDRWILQALSGPSELGRYVALYQIGFLPAFLVAATVQEFGLPIVFQTAERRDSRAALDSAHALIRTLTRSILVLGVVMAFGAFIIGRPVTELALGEAFRPASWLISIGALSGALFGAGETLTLPSKVAYKSREIIFPRIMASLFAVLCYVVGSVTGGFVGLTVANLVAAAAYYGIMSLWVRRDGTAVDGLVRESSIRPRAGS